MKLGSLAKSRNTMAYIDMSERLKINELPPLSPLDGSELLPIEAGDPSVTRCTSVQDIANFVQASPASKTKIIVRATVQQLLIRTAFSRITFNQVVEDSLSEFDSSTSTFTFTSPKNLLVTGALVYNPSATINFNTFIRSSWRKVGTSFQKTLGGYVVPAGSITSSFFPAIDYSFIDKVDAATYEMAVYFWSQNNSPMTIPSSANSDSVWCSIVEI